MPAVAVALSLASAGAASAQTGFQATVNGNNPLPKPCGHFACGTASTNYGPATWTFDVGQPTPYSNACVRYPATSTFMLADGSSLVLSEDGTASIACAPGNSIVAPSTSFGHPTYGNGNWTVTTATGQFSALAETAGHPAATGTDALHFAGASGSGTYTSNP
jgi:hypothetical protein